MKIKTSELEKQALDWAVAKCEGIEWCQGDLDAQEYGPGFKPSTSWQDGGPIIEREGLCVQPYCSLYEYKPILEWESFVMARCFENEHPRGIGPTPLVAAMRCFVASKLGDEVDVPDELVEGEKQ